MYAVVNPGRFSYPFVDDGSQKHIATTVIYIYPGDNMIGVMAHF